MTLLKDCGVAIVGAGPYGLSSGTHLGTSALDIRYAGEPTGAWANGTPPGFFLRSPWEASTISDPKSACPLEAYEATLGIALHRS